MAQESIKTCGGCYCGAVRYQIDGDPEYVSCCHCEDCRKTTGAPMVIYSVYLDEQVHFVKGARKIYESTPGIKRTFCADCGTPLSYEAKWLGQTVVAFLIGTLDKPELFPPERHVFDVDRISWFDVVDHLPRYHQVPTGKDPVRFGPVEHFSHTPD